MDDLSHQPEVFFHRTCLFAKFFHELKIKNIGTIQTNAINIKLINPETNHIKQIFFDLRILKVQTRKFEMILPGIITKRVPQWTLPVKADPLIPAGIGRIPSVLLNIPEGEKLAAGVVEYAVHNHADVRFVA